MKKLLLFSLAVGIGIAGFAQKSNQLIPADLAKRTGKINIKTRTVSGDEAAVLPLQQSNGFVANKNISALPGVIIGGTSYDLQSNGSTDNHRIYKYSDGKVSGTWTYSNSMDLAAADRGTGYNHFNGTAWGALPTARIETSRVGWPSMAPVGTNEFVITHASTAGISFISTKSPVGGTAWTAGGTPTPIAQPILWPRLASAGPGTNDLYMIGLTLPTGNGGAVYNNLDGAIVFSKSADGGTTWDPLTILPGMESTDGYYGFSGDGYAIDCKGDTIAIAVFGDWFDSFIMKSTDGGTTWVKTVFWAFPIPNYNYIADDAISDVDSDGIADSLLTSDQAGSVIIDNDGMVHVLFGLTRVKNDVIGDASSSYYPYTDGLIYWNEGMSPIDAGGGYNIAGMEDVNGNDTIDFWPATSPALPYGAYFLSLTSMPNMGINAAGDIYAIYSSVVENTDYGDQRSFRNIYMFKHLSGDPDTSWTTPVNITQDDFSENVFGSLARTVDNNLYMLWQSDGEPGLVVRGLTPNPNTVYTVNDIRYLNLNTVGINENPSATMGVSQNYPNPFNGTTTISVNLKKADNLSVDVSNMLGQKVNSIPIGFVAAGQHDINLDCSNLNSGIYFYTVKAGENSVTRKMIVE